MTKASIKQRPVKAALFAGVTGAVVSLLLETPINWFLFNQTPWAAMRMAAAIVLGPSVLTPPTTFDWQLASVATVVHVGLSIACAFGLAPLVHRLSAGVAAIIGGLFGGVVYFVNLHGIAPLFFPWFAELRNAVTVFSHVVLGMSIAATYALLRER